METTEITGSEFWRSREPVVLAPPHLAAEGRDLQQVLRGSGKRDGEVVFASSGTSGPPKWVVHRRETLLASAGAVNRHLEVGPGDCWMLALPAYHVGGFGVAARAQAAECRRVGYAQQRSDDRS